MKRKKAYKLLRLRKDGTLGSLFINKKQVIPVGNWLQAEDHPTRGYARRPGWHVCMGIIAPHLTMKGRIWCEVEVEDYVEIPRPASQGNVWLIANRLRVLKRLPGVRHENPFHNPRHPRGQVQAVRRRDDTFADWAGL